MTEPSSEQFPHRTDADVILLARFLEEAAWPLPLMSLSPEEPAPTKTNGTSTTASL